MPENDCLKGCLTAVRKLSDLLSDSLSDSCRTDVIFSTINQRLGCPSAVGHLPKMNAKVCLSDWGGFFRTPQSDTRTEKEKNDMVEIDFGFVTREIPPSDQACSLQKKNGVGRTEHSWMTCFCHFFVLERYNSKIGPLYREVCPCCQRARIPMRSGVSKKSAESIFGSIRVEMAIDRESLQYAGLDERLMWAEWWRWRVFYREHLNSPFWQNIRSQVVTRYNGRCCRCGDVGTDVHHLTYENVGNENLEDLILLCRKCHQSEHNRRF